MQEWIGQPCCFCEGTIGKMHRLPAEVEEYCESAGVGVGMYCRVCSTRVQLCAKPGCSIASRACCTVYHSQQ